MTRRVFRSNVALVLTYYVLLGLLFVFGDFVHEEIRRLKEAETLLLAIPAAWLAECFRRRSNYLSEVKKLYSEVLDCFQSTMAYTRRSSPTDDDYVVLVKKVSMTIDIVRAQFENIGSTKASTGLYPVEGLKAIYAWIEWLGGGQNWRGANDARDARAALLSHWQENVRDPLLLEMDRFRISRAASVYLGKKEWPMPPAGKGKS